MPRAQFLVSLEPLLNAQDQNFAMQHLDSPSCPLVQLHCYSLQTTKTFCDSEANCILRGIARSVSYLHTATRDKRLLALSVRGQKSVMSA